MEENPEENSENLNKNEDTVKTTNTRLIGIIAVLTVALIVVIIVFCIFLQRSAKATVKDVAKVVKNADIIGAIDLVDPAGIAAFMTCYNYRSGEIDFEDFDENYEKIEKGLKKIKKEIKKGKYSIDVTSTKKVSDAKKITKVTCDIKVKYNDNEIKLKGIEIYTMKKGFKNYIIGINPESLEDAEEQLDEQDDSLYDIVDDLEDELEDIFD